MTPGHAAGVAVRDYRDARDQRLLSSCQVGDSRALVTGWAALAVIDAWARSYEAVPAPESDAVTLAVVRAVLAARREDMAGT